MSQPSVRSLGATIYLPSALYGIGQGAIAPVIAVSAVERGASIGMAGFLVALVGIGQLLGDIPAGLLAAKLGEQRAMLHASVVTVAAMLLCLFGDSLVLLGLGVFVSGLAGAVWFLARHSYITEVVPPEMRGRALSALGGVQRIGRFAGPFLGAAGIALWGTGVPYVLYLLMSVVSAAVLLWASRYDDGGSSRPEQPTARPRLTTIALEHRSVLLTLGAAIALTGLVRSSRTAIIPLWGHELGLSPTAISIVFGISNAVELIFVYPIGVAMDRHGRRIAAIPSMFIMAVSMFCLIIHHDSVVFVVASVLMGVGNGFGAGIVMILGSDASPTVGRAEFLSVWRLFIDAGNGSGPLLIGLVAGATTLGVAVTATGAAALLGAWTMHRYVPRRHTPLDEEHAGVAMDELTAS
jgi:MFS family permease